MLSLPIHHIRFVECFHPCIVLQLSTENFFIGESNLLSSPVIKSHLSPLTSKLNLLQRPGFLPGTSSPPNFQHVSSSIKVCLFLMTLFNAILPNQPTQYILVNNILGDIILLFLAYLKFCSNMSGILIHYIKQYNNFLKLSFDCFITCIIFNTISCIEIDSVSTTSKDICLVVIYIALFIQNKTFVDKVQKHFGSGNCCGKCTKNDFQKWCAIRASLGGVCDVLA